MDQSDLMTVRDTLDAVVSGNVQVEDVVTALEIVEASINDVPAFEAQYTNEPVAEGNALVVVGDCEVVGNDNEAS